MMSNLDVAVESFWQLDRHWNQGGKAKLELSCEDGNLHMQLSAVLGHPDQPHFPHPPPHHPPPPQSFPPPKKKKSPSQLRRQERRKQEALGKAEEAGSTKTVIEEPEEVFYKNVSIEVVSEAEFDNTSVKIVDNPAEANGLIFKCDQCAYTNLTEKGLGQHTRMKHRISQLDGNFDLVEDDSKSEYKVEPCPFCSEDELAKFCQCRNYEECECMVTQLSMNIHIINAHEPNMIWAHFGKDWVMKNKEWIQNDQWKQTWRSLNVL